MQTIASIKRKRAADILVAALATGFTRAEIERRQRDTSPKGFAQPVTPSKKGHRRNEACACGSGKKFKKCCLTIGQFIRNGASESVQCIPDGPPAAA